jgi:hypothetical protein
MWAAGEDLTVPELGLLSADLRRLPPKETCSSAHPTSSSRDARSFVEKAKVQGTAIDLVTRRP